MDSDLDQQPSTLGVTALLTDGRRHALTDVTRLPDEDGVTVWLVRIPADVPLARPFVVHCEQHPPRAEIRFEWQGGAALVRT